MANTYIHIYYIIKKLTLNTNNDVSVFTSPCTQIYAISFGIMGIKESYGMCQTNADRFCIMSVPYLAAIVNHTANYLSILKCSG